jgi:hypothetical protein
MIARKAAAALVFPVLLASGVKAETPQLVIEKPEIILTEAQMPYTMDGSWAPLRRSDGRMVFFATALAKKPYYFRYSGTMENPWEKEEEPFIWDFSGHNDQWPSGLWLMNIITVRNGSLIGMVHREDIRPDRPATFSIGLAKSTDGGSHWKFLGDVIAPKTPTANIGGAPCLIVGKWLYLYFNERGLNRLCVARASLEEVITAAVRDTVPRFKKYSGGQWNEDGLTGTGENIIPGALESWDFHSDAAYCRPLGKAMITVQTHHQSQLLLFTSNDGLNWSDKVVLDEAPDHFQPYSSIIGFDPESAADCHEVGKKFYIYFTRKKLANYDDDTICRIKCSVQPSNDK